MDVPDRQLWSGMLSHLRDRHAEVCRQWFEEIEPVEIVGGVLRLRAHSPIHRDYLQRNCLPPFNDAAQAVSQRLLSVQFVGPEEGGPPGRGAVGGTPHRSPRKPGSHVHPHRSPRDAVPGRPAGEAPRSALLSDQKREPPGTAMLVLNPDYAFEHFVVGPENRLAHAAAVAIAGNPGFAYNPYFVHGGVGLGKTHLLQAVCLRIKDGRPGARIYYTSCDCFMTQFMDAVQAGEMSQFRHTFRDVDVLVIDDIHFLAGRERTQEEFFHTFNSLYQLNKQIILSSDAAPEEIPDLEERLVSRFKWGLVATVAPPSYETRVAIVKNKARLRGFGVADDVACYVAAKIDSNIRELEGAVVKIHVVASVESRDPDLEMARAALGEQPGRSERQIQIQVIINAVTDFYQVKVTDLQSKRRHRSITRPRQVCMYLARKHTRHSLEEIGGYFGGRDHTTVMHAVRTVEKRQEAEPEFQQAIRTIEDAMRVLPTERA